MDLYIIRKELLNGKSIYDLNIKVTFYTRVSTSTNEQLNSLKNQITYFKDFIQKQNNWQYIKGYIDEGITGTSSNKRNSFNKMIDDSKNKKFDLIITKEVSRFARNTLDSLFYTRELLKAGVGVYFQNDNINTLMPDSELRLTIMASMAQEESRKISDRVKWGHQRSIKNGRVLGNNKIWGYNKNDGKLTINKQEAKMIEEIFILYCEGKGLRTIANILKEKKFRNHNGNTFNFTSLRNIITNPKYKGYYVGNKSTTIDFLTKKRQWHDKKQWIIYKDYKNIPPIVSEEIWEKANFILKKRSEKMSSEDKTSYQNKFLYSGKIICMDHNTTYWRNIYKYDTIEDKEVWQCKVYRQGGKSACNNAMLYKHELDLILKTILNEIFSNKELYINKLMDMYTTLLNEMNYSNDIKELMKEIEIIKKRKDKLLDLNIDGLIDNSEFKKRNEKFNININELEKQIEKYSQLNDIKLDSEKQLKYIKKALEKEVDFKNQFNEKIAEQFLDKIEVYNTKMDNLIHLRVILKSGISIPVNYIVNKNMRMLPSIHMIRADIETEIAPIVGTEKQSEELVNYLLEEFENEPAKIWESNMFGKTLHELINEGLQNKLFKMPEDAQLKLQETLQRIINEGNGGLICIIL
jgi:site-specific DNA recombinase